jgi:hypothetical protein
VTRLLGLPPLLRLSIFFCFESWGERRSAFLARQPRAGMKKSSGIFFFMSFSRA